MWVRNSRGKPDALLTIAVATVAVVLFKVLLAGVVIFGMKLGGIDSGMVAALLTPSLGSYTWKRVAKVDQWT